MAAAGLDIVTEVCRRFADNENPFELLSEDVIWREVPMFDHDDPSAATAASPSSSAAGSAPGRLVGA